MSNAAHTLVTTQGELSYFDWGSGDPVLCLHGLGDQGIVWESLGTSLADTHRVIALDLPGHGDSYKPSDESAFASPKLVSLLEEFANTQNLENLTVIAHSWSAKLALIWAKQNPTRIKQLILVDPFFVNRFPGLLKITLPLLYRTLPFLKMMGPFTNQAAAETMAKSLKQYQGWSLAQQKLFQTSVDQKTDGSWGSKFSLEARNGVFLDTFEVSGLIDTVDVPCQVLLPKDGLNRRPWQIKPYKTHLPQLTLQTIAGNHWPHLVEAEQFNCTIQKILSHEAI